MGTSLAELSGELPIPKNLSNSPKNLRSRQISLNEFGLGMTII